MSSASISIRSAIVESAKNLDQAQSVGKQPPGFTYVPPTHARALDIEVTLVEGMRGAGKSFWWSSLVSEELRSFLHVGFPEARFSWQHELGDFRCRAISDVVAVVIHLKQRVRRAK